MLRLAQYKGVSTPSIETLTTASPRRGVACSNSLSTNFSVFVLAASISL